MSYHFRDYQHGCHDAVLKAWGVGRWADMNLEETHADLIARLGRSPFKSSGASVKSTIANLTTSAGKTIIASFLMKTLVEDGARVMFMADSDELCQQPREKLRESTGLFAAVEKAESRASLMSQIVISSAQTMARKNRRQKFPSDHFHFAIVDEAHRGSPRNKEIMEHFHGAKVLGLTATAFRSGMKDLKDFYEDLCFELGTFDMIGQGYITPLKVLAMPINIDLTEVKQSYGATGADYDAGELGSTIEPHFDAITKAVSAQAKDRQIISFLPLISSSQKFVGVCRKQGISAEHVDGNSENRAELLERFANREFQLLSNSMLLTTGWDCHAVDCLLNLRPTRSIGLYRQMVGRIVRVLRGVIDGIESPEERRERIAASRKPDALILDLLWQYEKLIANPASLIADTEEDAEKMMRKIRDAGDAEFLTDVSRAVQLDKENQLAEMLKANANRKATMFDAKALALMMHNMTLADYEPTFRWETKPITSPQRQMLTRNCVDTDSIAGRGHASAVIDAIQRHKQSGMATLEQMIALRKMGIEDPAMTAARAAEILGGDMPMPFGKYQGQPISSLSRSYMAWLSEQEWLAKWPAVFTYVQKHKPGNGVAAPIQ